MGIAIYLMPFVDGGLGGAKLPPESITPITPTALYFLHKATIFPFTALPTSPYQKAAGNFV